MIQVLFRPILAEWLKFNGQEQISILIYWRQKDRFTHMLSKSFGSSSLDARRAAGQQVLRSRRGRGAAAPGYAQRGRGDGASAVACPTGQRRDGGDNGAVFCQCEREGRYEAKSNTLIWELGREGGYLLAFGFWFGSDSRVKKDHSNPLRAIK